jgi:hypothetical protein
MTILKQALDVPSISTLAYLAANPGPGAPARYWLEETAAPYEFVPGDATAIDGWTSIAPTPDTGRYLLRGDRISIKSVDGGVSDDWVRLNLAMAAVAGKCKLVLRAGAWKCATQGTVPGQLQLECEPGVSITTTLGVPGVVFKAIDTTGTTGALTSNVTVGSTTFRDNTLYAVGDRVRIGGTGSTNIHIGNRYRILAVTPGVPNIYTVERPILFPFVTGDPVRLITAEAKWIEMIGNGAVITGPCDYAFQFQSWESRIRGWRYVSTSNVGSAAYSIELSSLETWGEDLYYDLSSNTAAYGLFLECGERTGYRTSGGVGGQKGISAYDCVDSAAENCVCSGASSIGAHITCHPTQTAPGCQNFTLKGGGFHGGGNIGVMVQFATDTSVIGVGAYFNVQGFNAGATSGVAVRTKFVACSSKGNSQYPFVTTTTATDTVFEGCSSSADAAGALLASSTDLVACKILDGTVGVNFPVVIQNGPNSKMFVRILGCHISMAAAGGAQPLVQIQAHGTGTLVVEIANTYFEMKAAGQTAVQDSAGANGVTIIRDSAATQTAASNGYVGAAACSLRKYGRVDFGGLGTPYTINAAGFVNSPTGNTAAPAAGVVGQGTLGLNGAAAVAYPFPDIKAGDPVKITRRVVAGAPLPGIGFVITPGTGVAVTGTATDTSVVDLEIG